MPLNKQQRIAAKVYGSGDFGHITSLKEAEKQGDTLFVFVMRELSDEEECEDIGMARDRMNSAICDIQVVLDALAKEGQ